MDGVITVLFAKCGKNVASTFQVAHQVPGLESAMALRDVVCRYAWRFGLVDWSLVIKYSAYSRYCSNI